VPSGRGLWVATLTLLLGAAAFACSDLFHSTTDIRTACEIDPTSLGCEGQGAGHDTDGGPDASNAVLDFCAWSPADAKLQAMHACAWLGACETPMGKNAFGPCMFEALLAYDCASNPDHRVNGVVHELWACLASARTCDGVNRCVLPTTACGSGDYTTCLTAPNGVPAESVVRVECSDSGAHAENCLLWSQACTMSSGPAACGGPSGSACSGGAPSSCIAGSQLRCGRDGGDLALDCAGNGAGVCSGFPQTTNADWVSCLPDDAGPDAACAPTLATTCTHGAASSCPSGIREGLDCNNLLGADAACTSGSLNPPFDWTSPCAVTPPQCTVDICSDGGASPGTTLVGCVRGATFSVNCTAQGLGLCQVVTTDVGAAERPACRAP